MTFLGSERAASEVIGHVIVLGLTLTGISIISLVGVPAIFDLQDMANVRNAEQAFTVMDSRVSAVMLGNSPLQFLDVNLRGGTISVEPNGTGKESYIQVNIANGSGNQYITVPMGTIKYRLGERIVAYEGGGVWSKYPSGGSVMLSPPEFHYNGVTMTLPVINVSGAGSIGGTGSARLKFVKGQNPVIIYPDASNPNRINPVNGSAGGVYVNITSEFYDAWADYAKSLGYTVVSEDGANRKVSIKLTVIPSTLGKNTSITNPIEIRGLNPKETLPMDEFNVRLNAKDHNGLNSLNWQLMMASGTKKLIIHVDGVSGGDSKADIGIAYQDTSRGTTNNAEIWKKDNAFQVFGSGSSAYVDIDLLNPDINLTYDDKNNVGSTSGDCTKILKNDFNDTTWTWTPQVIKDETKTLNNVTQHYIMLFAPDIHLRICSPGCGSDRGRDCGSDPVDYGDSTMLINYTSTGALSYLHISDNRADVTIS
jgi:hypothetical protein